MNDLTAFPPYVQQRVGEAISFGLDVYRVEFIVPFPTGDPFYVIRKILRDGGCSVEKILAKDLP